MTGKAKESLRKKHYYMKLPNGDISIQNDYSLGVYRWCKDGDKIEVLGDVPEYEVWKSTNENMDSVLKTNRALSLKMLELKKLLKKCAKTIDKVNYGTISKIKEKEKLLSQIDRILQENNR